MADEIIFLIIFWFLLFLYFVLPGYLKTFKNMKEDWRSQKSVVQE